MTIDHAPHRRTRSRPAKLAALLLTAALLSAAFLTFHAAFAARATKGVEYVHFDARPDACLPDQALPCLPDAGTGRSNTIYVRQNPVDGAYRYNEVFGTGPQGDVWFQTTLSGRCGSGYRVSSLSIDAGHEGDHAGHADEVDETLPGFPIGQPVNHDHRTIPNRNVAVHVPVEQVVGSMVFDAPVDLLAWGENRIADRVAQGVSEENARIEPYTHTTSAGLNATLVCRKRANHDKKPYATDSTWHSVEIVWLGVGMQPGEETEDGWRDGIVPDDPTPPQVGPDLSVGFQVTDATLSALSDPTNPCMLHLSGVVRATEPGPVRYRYVNELGQRSQTFATEVDHTLTAMFSESVELEPVVLDPSEPAGAPDELTASDDGQIGGLVQEQGDNVQGYFQLEVVEPHAKSSNIASYNVDGCAVAPEKPDTEVDPLAPPTGSPDEWTTNPTVPPVPVPPPDDLAPTPPPTNPSPSGLTELTAAG